jgi:predicted secreted Zn-dependent protease
MLSLARQAPAEGNMRRRGSTRWEIHWTVDRRSDDVCDLATAAVTRRLTVVLPHWDPEPDTDPGLLADWERYVRAVADHERGHVELLVAGADRIPPAIRAATCATADAVGHAVLDELRAENAAYDRDTNHGRNQGAWFGPGPVERSALSLPARR